jgi:hypothetical protein
VRLDSTGSKDGAISWIEAFSGHWAPSEVVRHAEVRSNRLYRRRQDLRSVSPGFADVVVSADFPDRGSADVLSHKTTAMIGAMFSAGACRQQRQGDRFPQDAVFDHYDPCSENRTAANATR